MRRSKTSATITRLNDIKSLYKERNKAIRGLVRTSFGSIFIYDVRERTVLYAQWLTLKNMGYGEDEFPAISHGFFRNILHPEDRRTIRKHLEELKRSKKHEVFIRVVRFRDKKGKYQSIAIRQSVLNRNPDGTPSRLIGSMVNITKYKCVKRQRDKNIAIMENLAYRSSHELRAPVATLLGLITLLRHDTKDRTQFESILESLELTATKMDTVIKTFGDELRSYY